MPSFVGVIVSWYVVRFLNNRHPEHDVVGMRILSLVMTFVFFLYCDSYIATYGTQQNDRLVYLLPNLSFVLSVLLYAILHYHPHGKEFSMKSRLLRKSRDG